MRIDMATGAIGFPATLSNWLRALCVGLICLTVIACGGRERVQWTAVFEGLRHQGVRE